MSEEIEKLKKEISELKDLRYRLTQEAQIHKQEARTMKSIVHEIYQGLNIKKGNWNGAKPVLELFEQVGYIKSCCEGECEQCI